MGKQYLKRFAYGFLALALGFSGTFFWPAAGAYAIDDTPTCETIENDVIFYQPENDSNTLTYTRGEYNTLYFYGCYAGQLEITINGNPLSSYDDGWELEGGDNTRGDFGLTLGPSLLQEDESYQVQISIAEHPDSGKVFHINVVHDLRIQKYAKVLNAGESVVVDGPAGAEADDIKIYNLDTAAEPAQQHQCSLDLTGTCEVITNNEVIVSETSTGKYTVTANEGGHFCIAIKKDEDDYITLATTLNLTVTKAVDDGAMTVPTVMNEEASAGQEFANADENKNMVDTNPESTAEEKQRAQNELDAAQRIANAAATKISNAMYNGANGVDNTKLDAAIRNKKDLTTRVDIQELDEANVPDTVKNALLDKLDSTFSDDIKYFDINVKLYGGDSEEDYLGNLSELTKKQYIMIDMGENFVGPAAGFKRVFKILAYHEYIDENEERHREVIEIDNFVYNSLTHSLELYSDKFSTYMVAYKDVLAASVDTGTFTGEGASATTSMFVSVLMSTIFIGFICVTKFAKTHKQNLIHAGTPLIIWAFLWYNMFHGQIRTAKN